MASIVKDAPTGILYREWKSPSPKAVLVLAHGMGAHTGRWQSLGAFLQRNGIASYAVELKGFGETEGLKGHIDSVNTYFSDIRRLSSIAEEENPGKKSFLLGESMGALIAFAMTAGDPGDFSGLICVSPAFKSSLKVSALDYLNILFSIVFNPKRQLAMRFTSGMCTGDEAYQKEMDRDPREHRFASAGLLIEILKLQLRSPGYARALNIPALFLTAGEDMLVDPAASERIFDMIRAKGRRLLRYPGMRHALTIDRGKEKVFSDIIEWIDEVIGG
ncbi:alpha/beta hydrolase [Candidatus Omnitrophota bacterium]